MVLSHAESAGRPGSISAALDRRFEAVAFDWDGTGVPDRNADASNVRASIEQLCASGMEIFVVSGTHVGNVDGQLQARPAGPGRLFLCLNRGSEVYAVGRAGPERVHARIATDEEDRLLDEAARITIERLAKLGVPAEIVSTRLNRRKIDLIPVAEWADPPKARIHELLAAVEARLRDAGFGRLRDAVEVATDAARDAGLADPRITSDAKHVEIGLTDKSDSARWIFGELWRSGIDAHRVLVAGDEFGPLGGLPGSDSLMIVREAARATFVSVGVEPEGVPRPVVDLGGGPDAFVTLLEDQLERRTRGDVPDVGVDETWSLSIRGLDDEKERARKALLSLADGAIGTSGVAAVQEDGVVSDVMVHGLYAGEGPETELVRAPAWNILAHHAGPIGGINRTLDMRSGMLHQEISEPNGIIKTIAFSSLERPGVVVLRADAPARTIDAVSARDAGAPDVMDGRIAIRPAARGGGVAAAASESRTRHSTLVSVDRVGAYLVDRDAVPAASDVLQKLEETKRAGFEALLVEQRRAWARRWAQADIVVDGDPELQQAIRFALFHLIASVCDADEAAVGARGLSGTGYRGHVFWDADVFVLPFLAATHPAAARAMLEYRIRRLPAARAAARALGREGARFPWESAGDGVDVTPSMGRDRSGRVFPIRTGQLEEHVVADVAWAAATYMDWTHDEDFIHGPGRTLLVETARYWASRVRVTPDGRGHLFGVTGPDEYHEPVDDNAFTNVMARWNLRRAAGSCADLDGEEVDRWRRTADALVDNYQDDSGLYEQFSGFWRLEPLVIADLAPKRPIAAELLLGRDRVRRAQVVKQADVLMMHHMVPGEVAAGSLEPNLEFYEPRTAHGSSLSPGVHASLFARAGQMSDAVRALHLASRLDLDDLTGTTAAGLHVATMGSVWQAMVYGFAGVRPAGNALRIDPHIPPVWKSFEINLRFRGTPVRIVTTMDGVTVTGTGVRLQIGDGPIVECGSDGVALERSAEGWKVSDHGEDHRGDR